MIVLGVHSMTHDIGVALFKDGRPVCIAEEERLSGRKHQPGIEVDGTTPERALVELLTFCGLTLDDVDIIAHAGGPGAPWMQMDNIHQRYRAFAEQLDPGLRRTRFFGHHECHAAVAYYGSGYGADDDSGSSSNIGSSAVLTIDGAGCDHLSTTMWRGQGRSLELLDEYPSSQSLGFFYSRAAETVGLGSYGIGEGKLMALAALGQEPPALDGLLSRRYGRCRIAADLTERFADYKTHAPELPRSADFAAAVQAQLTATMTMLAMQALERASTSRLCLAGGVALNCRANGELLNLPGLDALYIPPMPGDSGLCAGAAYLGAIAAGDRPAPLSTPFLGLPIDDNDLAQMAREAGATQVDDPHARAADIIAAGGVVAWMQGRAETGPRALGHRSILADPRVRDHVDRLNRVKGREPWRPVAPAIATHAINGYCMTPAVNRTMGIAVPMTAAARADIPAALHVDGSARVQHVTPADEHMHRLLTHFEQRTGIPCLLNTSLNGPGQPLCHRVADALQLFRTTDIDALVIGNRILCKTNQ